jgi:alkylated DNA repair dioxygenase AlkB
MWKGVSDMRQDSLFVMDRARSEMVASSDLLPEGLIIMPDFISIADETALVAEIDGPEGPAWGDELRRRVKHFGFRYNYKSRAISMSDKIDDIPRWARGCADRLIENGHFESAPDQLIVNEYEPGQGISSHIDRASCFGPVVASLSLLSDVVMDFESADGAKVSALLPSRSMLVLSGPARYAWKHGIAARKRDSISGIDLRRQRRLSLTYRTVLFDRTD